MQQFIRENRLLLLIFALAYMPYILNGGIIYDDWSVVSLSLMKHFREVYANYFPSFSNRPLAPVYYYYLSRFGMHFFWIVLTDVLIWGAAMSIYYRIVARNFSAAVAAIFILFAMLPIAAATTIFSPGMQSIGALSCLLMGISLALLEKYLNKGEQRLYYAAYGVLLVLFFTYEVAFPLLAFHIILPYLRQDRFLPTLRNLAGYLRMFVLPVLLVLLAAVVYQKWIIPCFSTNISRIRMAGGAVAAEFFGQSIHSLWEAYTVRIPQLAWRAVDHIQYLSRVSLSLWMLQCALAGVFLFRANSVAGRPPRHAGVILLCLALFLNGVVFLVVGYTNVELAGYANRSSIALNVAYAFFIALALSVYYPLGRIIAIAFYVFYSLGFTVERDNYIHSAHLAQIMPQDAITLLMPHMAGMAVRPTILGDVPEFLNENYNDETIISDEVTDWNMTLDLYSHRTIAGIPLTPRKVHEHKVEVRGNRLIVDHGLYDQGIVNFWFYRYRQGDAHGTLVQVKDKDDLLHIIDQVGQEAP